MKDIHPYPNGVLDDMFGADCIPYAGSPCSSASNLDPSFASCTAVSSKSNIQVRLRQALSGAGGRFADVPEVGFSHAGVNLQLRETNIAPCDAAVAVPPRSRPTASDEVATTPCGSRPGPGKEDQDQTEKNYGAGGKKHRAMDREQRETLQKL